MVGGTAFGGGEKAGEGEGKTRHRKNRSGKGVFSVGGVQVEGGVPVVYKESAPHTESLMRGGGGNLWLLLPCKGGKEIAGGGGVEKLWAPSERGVWGKEGGEG